VKKAKWWVILLLLIAWAGTAAYAATQRNAARDAGIALANVEADLDTARNILLPQALDSTTNAWQRLVVQAEIERDSLDAALEARPVIRLPGRIIIDSIPMPPDTVEIVKEAGDEFFDWETRAPPFSIQGHVALLGAPTEIPVEARVSCVPGDVVDAASVMLLAEDPFHIVPGRVVADPDVCNPPPKFSLIPDISVKGIGYDLLKVVIGAVAWELIRSKDDCPDCYYDDPNY
jgi:hypothetical protein